MIVSHTPRSPPFLHAPGGLLATLFPYPNENKRNFTLILVIDSPVSNLIIFIGHLVVGL